MGVLIFWGLVSIPDQIYLSIIVLRSPGDKNKVILKTKGNKDRSFDYTDIRMTIYTSNCAKIVSVGDPGLIKWGQDSGFGYIYIYAPWIHHYLSSLDYSTYLVIVFIPLMLNRLYIIILIKHYTLTLVS